MAQSICAILRLISPEGNGVEPVPDTEQEAQRPAQAERVLDWLQVRQYPNDGQPEDS